MFLFGVGYGSLLRIRGKDPKKEDLKKELPYLETAM